LSRLPFDTVLVANRGEIAVRILKTVRELGLRGAIVYHAQDAGSPADAAADLALEIKGPTPTAAYLDGAQIVEIAAAHGVNAIHPGYGFLSENAKFAQAVADARMVFVGPRPETIDLMGDKIRARNFVSKHGYPIAPSALEDDDPATFEARALGIGVPIVIKPAAGGGGKGMRVVRHLADFPEELARAKSESLRYFGNSRVYVERYIERPRHIDVQILGDSAGNVVHMFERECSIQRRFQKIVEESPSPTLTEDERIRICETAAGIAREARYLNAGTVEFICGKNEFYFLEMNTRLQVEHPVTEEITGFDLVAEQLRIAGGEPLGYDQLRVRRSGHAMELRIYAEDPARGFLPTTGRLLAYRPPANARVDSGVAAGSRITAAFDPMLAKLVVHGSDRAQAIERARHALREFIILGCGTNAEFLQRLLADPDFVAGDLHTQFIDAKPELTAEQPVDNALMVRLLGVAARALRPITDAADAVPPLHSAMSAWRN
jgi:acetyl-CoA/propionyl-CoA carboxylase biotin carboxyl carrier protein